MATLQHPNWDKLPNYAQRAFRAISENEAMSEKAISDIVCAGELSGQWNKLLGFAPLYFALKEKGIQISDILSMAKDQQREVNLDWFLKRWSEVHNKWSRAAALQKLSEQQTRYDLGDYEKHLPKKFKGYLIRNSRQLGREGLRQRHCVAGYDGRVAAGHCAFAVVFVDRVRWTVELRTNPSKDVPLRITQVKARYNRLADADVLQRVREQLQIEEAALNTKLRETHIGDLQRLLPVLRTRGCSHICVSFSGCGDSGAIDDIWFYGEVDRNELVSLELSSREFADGRWRIVHRECEIAIDAAVESIVDRYLEFTNVDWYNNDGGWGECEINVERGVVELNINVNYSESTNEWSTEVDIETGEEL